MCAHSLLCSFLKHCSLSLGWLHTHTTLDGQLPAAGQSEAVMQKMATTEHLSVLRLVSGDGCLCLFSLSQSHALMSICIHLLLLLLLLLLSVLMQFTICLSFATAAFFSVLLEHWEAVLNSDIGKRQNWLQQNNRSSPTAKLGPFIISLSQLLLLLLFFSYPFYCRLVCSLLSALPACV